MADKSKSINKDSINRTLKEFDQLPNSAQVRLTIVKELLGISAATAWRLVKANKLRAYKLTPRTTTFNVGELRTFITSQGVL